MLPHISSADSTRFSQLTTLSAQPSSRETSEAGFRPEDFIVSGEPYSLADYPALAGVHSEMALRAAGAKLFRDVEYDLSSASTDIAFSWQVGEAFGQYASIFSALEDMGLSKHRFAWSSDTPFFLLQVTSPKIVSIAGKLEFLDAAARQFATTGQSSGETRPFSSISQTYSLMVEAFAELLAAHDEVALAGAQLFQHARARRRLDLGESLETVRATQGGVDFDPLDPNRRDLMMTVAAINEQLMNSAWGQQVRGPLEQCWLQWLDRVRIDHLNKWHHCFVIRNYNV